MSRIYGSAETEVLVHFETFLGQVSSRPLRTMSLKDSLLEDRSKEEVPPENQLIKSYGNSKEHAEVGERQTISTTNHQYYNWACQQWNCSGTLFKSVFLHFETSPENLG